MGKGTSAITVEPGWTHKEAAAAQLGVSIRQLENLAALGRIRKNRLARQVNERSARVLYSTEDIEALKAGKPNQQPDSGAPPAAAVARRDAVPWGDLIEQLAAIARAVPSPDRQAEQLEAMVGAISQAFSAPAREREAEAAERERAMMASIDRFIEILATQQAERAQEHAQVFEALAANLAALAKTFPPAPAQPWLTLKEAAEYSGLPASWLLAQARAGATFATNTSQSKRAQWRFNRAALG